MHTHSLIAKIVPVSSALILGIAGSANAQVSLIGPEYRETSVDRSFESAPKDCSDVRWSQSALRAFPSIGSACQSIEQRNGKTYVKLEGTVEEVKDQGKRVRVDFEDGGELTFRPSPQTNLYIDGQRTSFAEVGNGSKLTFYIPEDRLQVEMQPDPARVAFIIVPIDNASAGADGASTADRADDRIADRTNDRMTNNSRMANNSLAMNELPQTAGPLPLLGLGGVLLTMLGAGATLWRRRRQ
jgi:hypothetical protein